MKIKNKTYLEICSSLNQYRKYIETNANHINPLNDIKSRTETYKLLTDFLLTDLGQNSKKEENLNKTFKYTINEKDIFIYFSSVDDGGQSSIKKEKGKKKISLDFNNKEFLDLLFNKENYINLAIYIPYSDMNCTKLDYDNRVYFISNPDFIKKRKIFDVAFKNKSKTNNTSSWVYLNDVIYLLNSKDKNYIPFYTIKKDKLIGWIIKKNYLKKFIDSHVNNFVNFINDNIDQNDSEYIQEINKYIENLNPQNKKSKTINFFNRNIKTAYEALKKANFKCECNEEHYVFKRKNNDINYVEAHHLIPISYQAKFNINLDVSSNIISLCANCHREIHYGENARKIIENLFEKRKDELKKSKIEIELNELINLYHLK